MVSTKITSSQDSLWLHSSLENNCAFLWLHYHGCGDRVGGVSIRLSIALRLLNTILTLWQRRNKGKIQNSVAPLNHFSNPPWQFQPAAKFCTTHSYNAMTKRNTLLIVAMLCSTDAIDHEGNTFSRLGKVKSKSTSGTNNCDSFLLG